MKRTLLSYLSLATLIIGAVLGGYALVKIWLIRASLPPGTCPVVSNRPLLYICIALCLVSFVLTLLENRDKKGSEPKKGATESGGD